MEKTMDLETFVTQDPNAPITRGQAYGMLAGIVNSFEAIIDDTNIAIMENRLLMDELVSIIKDAGLFTAEEIKERLDKKREALKEQLAKRSEEEIEVYNNEENGGN